MDSEAVDTIGDRVVGVAAAVLVLSVIAWLDRANYFMRNRSDPAKVVGLREYNRKLGLVDVKLPVASHPWGKTRIGLVGYYLLVREALDKTVEWSKSRDSDRAVARAIAGLFIDPVVEAMVLLVTLSNCPGEFLAVPNDGKLLTIYYPDIGTPENKMQFESEMKDLYGLRESVVFSDPPESQF